EPDDDGRAARAGLEQLGLETDLVQQLHHVLGGGPLPRALVGAVVRRVEPDQLLTDAGDLVGGGRDGAGGVRCGRSHAATVPAAPSAPSCPRRPVARVPTAAVRSAQARPRRARSGAMSAARPRRSSNEASGSCDPPRASSRRRKVSPFSRVRPPFSRYHSTVSASSTSDQMYE